MPILDETPPVVTQTVDKMSGEMNGLKERVLSFVK